MMMMMMMMMMISTSVKMTTIYLYHKFTNKLELAFIVCKNCTGLKILLDFLDPSSIEITVLQPVPSRVQGLMKTPPSP